MLFCLFFFFFFFLAFSTLPLASFSSFHHHREKAFLGTYDERESIAALGAMKYGIDHRVSREFIPAGKSGVCIACMYVCMYLYHVLLELTNTIAFPLCVDVQDHHDKKQNYMYQPMH